MNMLQKGAWQMVNAILNDSRITVYVRKPPYHDQVLNGPHYISQN